MSEKGKLKGTRKITDDLYELKDCVKGRNKKANEKILCFLYKNE